MKVLFKGAKEAFACTEPVEQKLFQAGTAVGWAVMFHIHGSLSSSEIDALVTPDAISEMVFTDGEGEEQTSITLAGYSTIRACVIRHKSGLAVTELQFTKETKTKEEAQ